MKLGRFVLLMNKRRRNDRDEIYGGMESTSSSMVQSVWSRLTDRWGSRDAEGTVNSVENTTFDTDNTLASVESEKTRYSDGGDSLRID